MHTLNTTVVKAKTTQSLEQRIAELEKQQARLGPEPHSFTGDPFTDPGALVLHGRTQKARMARAERGGGARRDSEVDLQEQLTALRARLDEQKRLEKDPAGHSRDMGSFGSKRPAGNGSSSTPVPPSEPRPAGSPRSPRARAQDASAASAAPAQAAAPGGDTPGLLRRGRTLSRLRFGSSGEESMQLNMLMAARATAFAARLKGGGNTKGGDREAEKAPPKRRRSRGSPT